MSDKKISAAGIILIIIGVVVLLSLAGCVICAAIGNFISPTPNPNTTVITTPVSTQDPNTVSRSYKDDFTISVLEEYSGDAAWDMVWGDNPFIPHPTGKSTTYLLNVKVTCNKLSANSYSDGAAKITKFDILLEIYGDNYYSYMFDTYNSKYPEFSDTYLSEGESASGWILFEDIPIGPAFLTLDSWKFSSNKVKL